MAQAPVVGGFFATEPREEPGDGSTVFAEGGVPVSHGNVVYFIDVMTERYKIVPEVK